jgi:putative aldouronate transport system permease protein
MAQHFWGRIRLDLKRYKYIYLMFLPVLLYYIVFSYIPMAGQVIAFQNYRPARGILGRYLSILPLINN